MTIRIIDGNNVLRRKLEQLGATALTQLYVEAVQLPAGETRQIWVWDGPNAKKARREIFPGYKANRPDAPDEFYRTMDTFKQLLNHSNAIQITVPEYEADDVIAELVKSVGPDEQVMIDSNDGDFIQLLTNPNIQLAYVSQKSTAPEWMRLFKTLVGDSSDEIPGLSRFGQKTWETLTDDHKQILEDHITGETMLATEQEAVEKLGFKPAMAKALIESQPQLHVFWRIIGFLYVPWVLMTQGTTVGVRDTGKAQAIFNELALPAAA